MKRFNIVISKDDGGVEMYPMKEWLRRHPNENPTGLDPTTSTSHQLRDGLRKLGWTIQETETEIHLIKPGSSGRPPELSEIFGAGGEDDSAEPAEAMFSLEYQLRDFIAQNLDSILIDGKKLELYVDPTGRDGIEYPSGVGPIDILARDKSGSFFVFELKRARSPDHAIGQLARYMGWIKETIGRDCEVNGIIVAKTIGENLRYSIHAMPNVSLFEYEVEFRLKSAHQIPTRP